MKSSRSPQRLAKMLNYALARHPDQFGLVPDRQGYVKIKELLRALSEEAGWGYVRSSHLNEILLTLPDPPIEIRDALIRSRDRTLLPDPQPGKNLPKLLFTCVRRKAHLFTLENGIRPADRKDVILSSDRKLAERMGRRRDRQAVTLTVNVQQAEALGVRFERVGDQLFISGPIPPSCFSAPPLPKQAPEKRRLEQPSPPHTQTQPGSFLIDLENLEEKHRKGGEKRSRKEIDRKKQAKRDRRERPPWRR